MDEQEVVDQQESPPLEPASDPGAEAAAPDATPAPSEENGSAEESAEDATFRAGSWNGHPRYACPYCPHAVVADSGGDLQILQHIQMRHTRVQVSSVLGPDGKPVIHLEKR